MAEYEQTLCWRCKNTHKDKCSWFNPDDPQPVPGWVAELRPKYRVGESYMVRECPNFDPDDPRPAPGWAAEHKPPRRTFSGADDRGVSRRVRHWVARITYKGQRYYLGYFRSKEKAIAARRAAEEAIARGEEPCKQ